VILLADEITEKVTHLGDALGVVEVIEDNDLEMKLSATVYQVAKPAPDNKWEDLLTAHR
jgi:hypothetical protein